MTETVITLGGKAGQGLITVSDLLLRYLSRSGHFVFAAQDYMSRVRGGHNFMQIRIASDPVFAPLPTSHILVAFDQRTVDEHKDELIIPALVLHDIDDVKASGNATFIGIPIKMFAREAGHPVYGNSVALGAIAAVIGLRLDGLITLLTESFGKKGGDAAQKNVQAATRGYNYVRDAFPFIGVTLPRPGEKPKMLINGSQSIGLGLIAGGLQFISAYPMSPSTGVFNYVTSHAAELGILSEQAEDEIASVNIALGASAAGARAATSTSGGGLDLMAEGISLAGVAEIPIVIANIQRPGPATGLPTRTAQEDLDLALNIGHGEFPRFVFAPGTAEEAYYTAAHAMNLADKYQVPVFVLGDQLLVDSYVTLDKLNLGKVKYKNHLADANKVKTPYKRYQLTPSGVSPRLPYGVPDTRVMFDSHLHEEDGHITENIEICRKMVEKRFRKLAGMIKEPLGPTLYGDKKPQITLVCWGSTYGAAREAVDALNAAGIGAALAHFNRVSPFPAKEAATFLKGKKAVHVVEGNYQGQFARLLARETGFKTGEPILRYDGRPFTARYILDGLKRIYGNGKFRRVSL
ncbi:MAG: 2-oxoacid:acceptor oxidoreductase subunit alpha [Nitrospinae bacterium]|nr:2-oxoacid:acceptor oxidoreductase subunit alpha [Nitrospinota bacterium]